MTSRAAPPPAPASTTASSPRVAAEPDGSAKPTPVDAAPGTIPTSTVT